MGFIQFQPMAFVIIKSNKGNKTIIEHLHNFHWSSKWYLERYSVAGICNAQFYVTDRIEQLVHLDARKRLPLLNWPSWDTNALLTNKNMGTLYTCFILVMNRRQCRTVIAELERKKNKLLWVEQPLRFRVWISTVYWTSATHNLAPIRDWLCMVTDRWHTYSISEIDDHF